MLQLLIGSVLLSLLHALLPNHWLPLLLIGRKEKWSDREVTSVAFLCAAAHAVSTILIGFGLGLLGMELSSGMASFGRLISPAVLIFLGIYFIYQHHRHHHFHLHNNPDTAVPKGKIILALTMAMFLSPCLEIEGYFLLAGSHGIKAIAAIAGIYVTLSIVGMVLWIRWAFRKTTAFNWHSLEHNAGIITGATLIATGIVSFFVS